MVIYKCLDTLRANILAGKQVKKSQIPRHYITKYNVTNLYMLYLDRSRRLTYTLLSYNDMIIVEVLEIFPDHKSYEQRFGYN
jgi:hypothetical protein